MNAQSSLRSIWLPILSFLLTAIIATVQHWSAEDLAWSFWLAGLMWGTVYLLVYMAAQDRKAGAIYLFVLYFFYFIFGGFLYGAFEFIHREMTGHWSDANIVIAIPQAIAQAARNNWPFFIFSAITTLPDYILDARTVNFVDMSSPLYAREGFKMMVLIFILTGLTLMEVVGFFALYAILLIYFFPWGAVRNALRR